jgi:serine/threonine protein kinase
MNEREQAILEAALKLSPKQRADYLDSACGDDQLRQRIIEALLKAEEKTGGTPEQRAASTTASTVVVAEVTAPPGEKPGDLIGRYKLLQRLGEGGMGTVWMAEQAEPIRRKVALKIIKLGMDTKEVIARFEAERQALALMHHPNIAEVHDAGATVTGRPFFVMELVSGDPITAFCDKHKLSTEDRLNLFTQLCQAVQHAHQKGVIHRDIKPSNILVSYAGDGVRPQPKIIDFGIAKATAGQRLTNKTLVTQIEQFIGTPAYVSPEQAEMTGVDIDTRSDIYSLGGTALRTAHRQASVRGLAAHRSRTRGNPPHHPRGGAPAPFNAPEHPKRG